LGVCQPQGLVLPLTSVVEQTISLSDWRTVVFGADAPARSIQAISVAVVARRMRDAMSFMKAESPEFSMVGGTGRGEPCERWKV